MPRAHGARAQMALAFESVYGTAPAPGFRTVPFASTTLGSEQSLIASELRCQLSWQMARLGLLTATAQRVAQGESVAAASAAGTTTSLALQRFGHFNGSITRNETPLGSVVSAEVPHSNGLDRIETICPDGRTEGADPGMAALTGRAEVRFADTALITQAIDGTPCELVFAWSLGHPAENLAGLRGAPDPIGRQGSDPGCAALAMARALGFDTLIAAELLPEIEAVMGRKLNEQIASNEGSSFRS